MNSIMYHLPLLHPLLTSSSFPFLLFLFTCPSLSLPPLCSPSTFLPSYPLLLLLPSFSSSSPFSPPPPLLLLLLSSSSSPGCSSIYSVSSWFWCPRSCLSSVTLSSPTSSSDSMYPSPPGGGWWGRVSFMWRLPWSPWCCLLIIHSGGQGTTPYRDSCGESLDCNVCVDVCIPAHTHT